MLEPPESLQRLSDMEGEENQDKSVNGKFPAGKLINLNAPLLSTRRTNCVAAGLDRSDEKPNVVAASSRERIPFSWEQSPGKPKNNISNGTENDDYFLPPKPPPGRWSRAACWEYYFSRSCRSLDQVLDDVNDSRDGDADDGISLNTLDIFSLAESVDTNETRDRACCRSTLSSSENQEEPAADAIMNHIRISPSSNYMIQRFLPDAQALAAASTSSTDFTNIGKKKKDHHSILGSHYSCIGGSTSNISRAVSLRQLSPFSASKEGGCGLDLLLPWRMKPIKSGGCGVRSPVVALPTCKPPPWSKAKFK